VRTRLTFIGLWTACDDEGRYQYEPELLKADLWPFEAEVTVEDVEADVWELAKRALVCAYEVAGKRYVHVVNWREHQKINRPTPSRLPACSRNPHGGFPEDSSPRARAQEVEVEVEVETEQGSNTVVEQARPLAVIPGGFSDDPADILDVWDTWKVSTGKKRADFTPARRQAIVKALDKYPVQDVLDAVTYWVNDPWPERPQHNDITQLLHMGTARKPLNVLEKMRDLRDGPPPVIGKHTAEMARIAQDMTRHRPGKEAANGDLGRMDRNRALAQRQLSRPEG
jgi:hypothetical protein